MNKNEIKRRVPLGGFGLDPVLKNLIKDAQLNSRLANSPFPLKMRNSDWSRILLPDVKIPKGPFQGIIDAASRTADIYSSLNSVTNQFSRFLADMNPSAHIDRSMRPFALQNGPLQAAIDAGKRFAELHNVFGTSKALQLDAVRMAKVQQTLPYNALTKAVESAFGAHKLAVSPRIVGLAGRVICEAGFRQAFLERLEEEVLQHQEPKAEVSSGVILQAIEKGIEQSGVIEEANEIQSSVNRFFAWFGQLDPNLRVFAIGLITAILALVIEYGAFSKGEGQASVSVNQRVKIVQNITNVIFINNRVPEETRRTFRVVTKEGLPVFISNRRDSVQIGSLPATQVVIVRSQKRNWTQIEWKTADGEQRLTGWVFTRYLKKL